MNTHFNAEKEVYSLLPGEDNNDPGGFGPNLIRDLQAPDQDINNTCDPEYSIQVNNLNPICVFKDKRYFELKPIESLYSWMNTYPVAQVIDYGLQGNIIERIVGHGYAKNYIRMYSVLEVGLNVTYWEGAFPTSYIIHDDKIARLVLSNEFNRRVPVDLSIIFEFYARCQVYLIRLANDGYFQNTLSERKKQDIQYNHKVAEAYVEKYRVFGRLVYCAHKYFYQNFKPQSAHQSNMQQEQEAGSTSEADHHKLAYGRAINYLTFLYFSYAEHNHLNFPKISKGMLFGSTLAPFIEWLENYIAPICSDEEIKAWFD
ncbi:hypothetical protein H4219_005504, partial [Mycoemilia scoparia]